MKSVERTICEKEKKQNEKDEVGKIHRKKKM